MGKLDEALSELGVSEEHQQSPKARAAPRQVSESAMIASAIASSTESIRGVLQKLLIVVACLGAFIVCYAALQEWRYHSAKQQLQQSLDALHAPRK